TKQSPTASSAVREFLLRMRPLQSDCPAAQPKSRTTPRSFTLASSTNAQIRLGQTCNPDLENPLAESLNSHTLLQDMLSTCMLPLPLNTSTRFHGTLQEVRNTVHQQVNDDQEEELQNNTNNKSENLSPTIVSNSTTCSCQNSL
ncbi:hypothetical protein MBANPS3_012562, partial [Mucor bainieri]